MIDLKEDDPTAVHAMLEFMYKQQYGGDDGAEADADVSRTMLHVQCYTLGDKYDVRDLNEYALDNFRLPASES